MWRNGERGAAAVEFALVLPPLLLVLFGITDFGIILYRQQVITFVSRDAARFAVAWASWSSTPCAPEPDPPRPCACEANFPHACDDYVEEHFKNQLGNYPLLYESASANVNYTRVGNDVTVEIDYPLTFLVLSRLAPKFVTSELVASGQTQKAQTTMKLE